MNVKICSKLFRFIAQLRRTAYFSACYFAVASFSIKEIWKSSTIFQHNHLKKARNSRVSSFRSSFNAFVSLHNFSQHSLAPNYCVVGLIWNVRTTMYDIPLESQTGLLAHGTIDKLLLSPQLKLLHVQIWCHFFFHSSVLEAPNFRGPGQVLQYEPNL